jgi:hypothetical protein
MKICQVMMTAPKTLWMLLFSGFFCSTFVSIANAQPAPDLYPTKTPLYLKISGPIDSSNSFTGERVEATIVKPALGLPVGTTLVGIVEIARPSNSVPKSPAEIRLGFNEVRLPTGETRRITSPLRDLGLSLVRKPTGESEVLQLDKSNLTAQGIFRLGGIAVSKTDKKRAEMNSTRGTMKVELVDSFSSNAFTRYTIEGIQLRPSAGELLDKIEQVLEQPLRVEERATGVTNALSRGIISDEGVPTIVIGSDVTLTETIIVHELFHIDQRIRQFPNGIDLRILGPLGTDFEAQLGSLFGAYLLNPIEHAIFFPRMVEMGIDPYEQEAASIRQVIAAGGFPSEMRDVLSYQTEALSLWYMTAALGVGDSAVISENDRLFEENGFFESMRRGREAVNILRSKNPVTPQESAETIVASLNCLLGSLGTFSFDGWSSRQKGKIAERAAIITLRASAFATPQCN